MSLIVAIKLRTSRPLNKEELIESVLLGTLPAIHQKSQELRLWQVMDSVVFFGLASLVNSQNPFTVFFVTL